MADRHRPPGPPSRDWIGPHRKIVSAGARKEKLRQRSYAHAPGAAPRRYAELRAASAFSFLEGSSLPEDLVDRAGALGLPAVALVDRNGVYGAPRFYRAAKAAGIRALVGAEAVLDPLAASAPPERRAGPRGLVPAPLPPGLALPRLTLLVESRAGYRNLCRLLTAGALGKEKGAASVTWDQVAEHAEGLHVLTGGAESPVARALASGGPEAARRELERLQGLFPGRVHVELQRHGVREEEHRNLALLSLASALRLPVLATNGVKDARASDKPLRDVFTCLTHHTTLDRAGSLLDIGRERHLKSAPEMGALFPDLPGVLERSADLAERLDFTLGDLGYRFPAYPLPPGETPASHLGRLTWEGARTRFRPLTARAQAQIEKELALIEKLELAGYFLIVHDIVDFCRREKVLVQGRGSAANSAVCYALSITAVDPVKMDLLFERFLSEERGEWPDIDLDLPSGDQREKVIQHVYGKYGPLGAGMTANVITYRERSAARECAKVLGFSDEQVDKLAKLTSLEVFGEFRDAPTPENAQKAADTMRDAGFDPEDVRVRHFGKLARAALNLPRHLGQHSGGIVVADGRLDEVVPLEPASMPGRVVIQWDKDDCADLGIVKVDLLGLGMLGAIEETLPMIRENEGVTVDLAQLPPDDPEVFRMLNAADTIGLFQVESRAQMASLPLNAPKNFYDIVVQVAIIRPGPIVGGMVHPFFDRRRGLAPVTYPHPSLEPILKRTLGVPLFQEQLLRIAMVASGFSGGEAEELRRAMGFKRSEERMEALEKRLRDGMAKRGITGDAQDQIVKSITSFALYGFPESHAASFALIAYASAWLKAHHPVAFTASLLNAWPMGFYHPATIVKDAQRHGTEVLPVDVNFSGWKCRYEAVRHGGSSPAPPASPPREPPQAVLHGGSSPAPPASPPREPPCGSPRAAHGAVLHGGSSPAPPASHGAVRLGMRFVKGLRQKTGEAIEAARRDGPFLTTGDLARRTGVREDELTTLASAGALASMGLTRRAALWQAAEAAREKGELYAQLDDATSSPLPEMSAVEETRADYRETEMTTGPHLVAHVRPELEREGVLPAAALASARHGSVVKTAGAVIVRQRPGTAKGFVFLSLEDETGICQAIVRPDLFHEHRTLIVGAPGLIVEGPVQNRTGTISVRAERFWPLPSPEAEALPASHDFR